MKEGSRWAAGDEVITEEESMKEYMMLGFRRTEGINLDKFAEKYGGTRAENIFQNSLRELEQKGLIVKNNNSVSLTRKGMDFANLIFMEFV